MKNKIKNALILGAILSSSIAFADVANMGDAAKGLSDQVSTVTNLVVVGSTLLGIVFLVVGGLNLKKHGDNPQQVPLSKPLIFLTAGAILFGLGSTSNLIQGTIFGGGRASGSGGEMEDFTSGS